MTFPYSEIPCGQLGTTDVILSNIHITPRCTPFESLNTLNNVLSSKEYCKLRVFIITIEVMSIKLTFRSYSRMSFLSHNNQSISFSHIFNCKYFTLFVLSVNHNKIYKHSLTLAKCTSNLVCVLTTFCCT